MTQQMGKTHRMKKCPTGCYELQVIDTFQQPSLAKRDQVVAVPLLIKESPNPRRMFIGDMINIETIITNL